MNRALSIRSKNKGNNTGGGKLEGFKHKLTPNKLDRPELSRRLARLIKAENHVVSAYQNAGRDQANIAAQLSAWGEETGDDAVSEISDKLGVLLAEIAEQEDNFAHGMEDSRGVLKQIRNTESSVQPTRDNKTKIQDEIQKLKYKEPTSPKIPQLEQELVRAEAQGLVAEAQLSNITRQKLREAYDLQLTALIERSQKQILLAQHARQVLAVLDDTPVVPGETRTTFAEHEKLGAILGSAETDLKSWQPNWEALPESGASRTTAAGVPIDTETNAPVAEAAIEPVPVEEKKPVEAAATTGEVEGEGQHLAAATA